MNIRALNLNSLLVFTQVYRSGGMTLAAKELGMTQPGVTQQIRSLESSLNVELFHRMNKKLIPTKEADTLYEGLNQSFQDVESALSTVSRKDRQFAGMVRIGVPIEFGNNMVLPHLAKIRQQFPLVQFHITYGLPHELSTLILEGKLDFAFMDQYQMNPAIKTEVVYHETLVLCCTKSYFEMMKQRKKEREFFEGLSYIDYQKGELILRDWFERAYNFKKLKLSMASYCFDIQGVAVLISSSMGVGVLPEHVFNKLKENGHNLHQFRPKLGVVNNPISLAYMDHRWNVPLNQFVITILKDLIVKA